MIKVIILSTLVISGRISLILTVHACPHKMLYPVCGWAWAPSLAIQAFSGATWWCSKASALHAIPCPDPRFHWSHLHWKKSLLANGLRVNSELFGTMCFELPAATSAGLDAVLLFMKTQSPQIVGQTVNNLVPTQLSLNNVSPKEFVQPPKGCAFSVGYIGRLFITQTNRTVKILVAGDMILGQSQLTVGHSMNLQLQQTVLLLTSNGASKKTDYHNKKWLRARVNSKRA